MILTVRWLGVRRLNGRLPAVGDVPGAGVDGHGNLLAGGHGVGPVASTQSERTSVAAPYGFATSLPNICGWLRSGTGVASRTYQLDLVPGGDQPDCSGNGGGTSHLYGGHG